jgi:hypothetical protein
MSEPGLTQTKENTVGEWHLQLQSATMEAIQVGEMSRPAPCDDDDDGDDHD